MDFALNSEVSFIDTLSLWTVMVIVVSCNQRTSEIIVKIGHGKDVEESTWIIELVSESNGQGQKWFIMLIELLSDIVNNVEEWRL